jgi:hypothetical protein
MMMMVCKRSLSLSCVRFAALKSDDDTLLTIPEEKAKVHVRQVPLVIRYIYQKDPLVQVTETEVPSDTTVITLNELKDALIADGVNLRSIGQIRFYSRRHEAYRSVPADDFVPLLDVRTSTEDEARMVQLELLQPPRADRAILGSWFSACLSWGAWTSTMRAFHKVQYMAADRLVTRRYNTSIVWIGPKVEFCYRLALNVLVKPPFNAVHSYNALEFARGFDFCLGPLILTYASFKHYPGGLFSVGLAIGAAFGLSFIRRGSMVPVRPDDSWNILTGKSKV